MSVPHQLQRMRLERLCLFRVDNTSADFLSRKVLIRGGELGFLLNLGHLILTLQSREFSVADFTGGFDLGKTNGMRAPIVARKEHGHDKSRTQT